MFEKVARFQFQAISSICEDLISAYPREDSEKSDEMWFVPKTAGKLGAVVAEQPHFHPHLRLKAVLPALNWHLIIK